MSSIPITTIKPFYLENEDTYLYEIALDECGRGPMFGSIYAAAVILPRNSSFDFSKMKDSKKIHSKKKMHELANYIKEHALAYSICSIDETVIDKINILQADMKAMHRCIQDILNQMKEKTSTFSPKEVFLLIDGNYFTPFCLFDQEMNEGTGGLQYITYQTEEQGDAKYANIAAASILAKDARDEYILDLCEKYPELKSRYSLDKNMGYGTKAHLDGIKRWGITQWHRKTFGLCKTANYSPL